MKESKLLESAQTIVYLRAQISLTKTRLEAENESFGKLFRARREEKGLGLREVAKKMGITAPYLQDMEYGRRAPNEKMIKFFLD